MYIRERGHKLVTKSTLNEVINNALRSISEVAVRARRPVLARLDLVPVEALEFVLEQLVRQRPHPLQRARMGSDVMHTV